jgi:mannitol/fructose-specific phosphotransferase system IIA component (Ntr-type)
MLADYLTSEMIKLQVDAKNWEEAVRAGGALLVPSGKVEERYVDAMVAAVKDLGPYMVLAPGLALAHSRPEDGVKDVCMSIINLATPVNFGSKENDPVYVVISFGGIDHESHIGMLQELAAFLIDEDHQKFLKEATSVEEMINALRK